MAQETVILRLTGMHCAACVRAVEMGLADLEGVSAASVNLAEESAEVAYDPDALAPERIVQRVSELGYEARVVEDAALGLTGADEERAAEQRRQLRLVILGAALRLGIGSTIMLLGMLGEWLPGAQLAAVAIIVAVLSEALYTRLRFTSVLRRQLPARVEQQRKLTFQRFFAFFAPLVLTTVLTMIVQTLVTVVLGRMPLPLESLAVWPVLLSLLVILQSPGMALTEVVISLLDRPGAALLLRRVTWAAVAVLTLVLVLVAATPLAHVWFEHVSALSPELTELAVMGLWLGLAIPGLRLLTSWYQGAIIYGENTRGVLESVLVFLVTAAVILGAGIAWGGMTGLYVGVIGMTIALATQAAWLAYRAGPVLRGTTVPAGVNV